MLKKYTQFINEEVGLRNLSKIVKDYSNCEIYFHKDLDGVCSAIAMKEFLRYYYNIETVESHTIQYGGLEFAIKNTKEGNLPILVDFAHSKPMFTIATDHHQSQVGAEDTDTTYYKPSRSNVETISGEISYSDIFTAKDIELIQTVDSANFLKYDIKPEDLHKAVFKYDKTIDPQKNRFMMGFVVNRLLLAYKNKRITVKSLDGKRNHINKNILECLVLDSTASLYSIFNNIKHYINNAKTSDKLGRLATEEEITKNLTDYIERMKNYTFIEDPKSPSNVQEYDPKDWRHKKMSDSGALIAKGIEYHEEHKIISQYGGGTLFKPGSYDRYTPFKNYPEANFLCIVWPMGLIQVSCNPFIEKKLKEIDLGEIAKEVLSQHERMLKMFYISLEAIKKEFETSQDWMGMKKAEGEDYEGVGFRFSDLESFYKDCIYHVEDGKIVQSDINTDEIKNNMDTVHEKLTDQQKKDLSKHKISAWEIITRNSGGHPSITNLSGWNFLKYNKPALLKAFKTENYTDVLKLIAKQLVDNLKEKIDLSEKGEQIEYKAKDIELKGEDTNESVKNMNLKKYEAFKKI
jgi:hypothetical protein